MANSPKTVLLVEDDENDIFFMHRAFHAARIANPLHVVKDGTEAMNYLAGRGQYADRTQFPLPSLVLMDINLPFCTGLQVLQWVRQQPGLESLPVVVLTSSAESSDVDNAYRVGANSYLVKPPTAEKLARLAEGIRFYWLELNQGPEIDPKQGDQKGAGGSETSADIR